MRALLIEKRLGGHRSPTNKQLFRGNSIAFSVKANLSKPDSTNDFYQPKSTFRGGYKA